jgi:hypothetical protein
MIMRTATTAAMTTRVPADTPPSNPDLDLISIEISCVCVVLGGGGGALPFKPAKTVVVNLYSYRSSACVNQDMIVMNMVKD